MKLNGYQLVNESLKGISATLKRGGPGRLLKAIRMKAARTKTGIKPGTKAGEFSEISGMPLRPEVIRSKAGYGTDRSNW